MKTNRRVSKLSQRPPTFSSSEEVLRERKMKKQHWYEIENPSIAKFRKKCA